MNRSVCLAIALFLVAACGASSEPQDGTSPRDAAPDAAVAPLDVAAMPSDAAPAPSDVRMDPEPPLVRSTDFAEENGEVRNPDRGFYSGNRDALLTLVKVQLGAYCNTATLPATVLSDLRTRMTALRSAGRRAVMRFVYADDGAVNACGLADARNIGIVEGHIAQVAPFWTEFADVIAYVQAGFLGMWGEWNSQDAPAGTSLVGSADNRQRVLRALLDTVPATRAIGVRRPRFRDELTFAPADVARIGFHNDCFLSTANDYGTYDGARTVEAWKDYIHAATTAVPIGGETCRDDATYTACGHAIAEMARLRYAYLNEDYSEPVLDRWQREGCRETIRRRLGYRVVVRAVAAPAAIAAGTTLRVRLELENVGFAPPYSSRRLRVVLRRGSEERVLTPRGSPDTRTWQPGPIAPFDLVADVPRDLAAGDWEVRLALLEDASDARAYAMLFANDARVRDDTRRDNLLARVTVR
jgi:hypothetical protein